MKRHLTKPLIFAVVINFILFTVKLYIGLRTNSLCIYTDGINNLLDSVSSILAVICILFIEKFKSPNYPLGIGRLEYIVSFIMASVTTGAGILFGYNSIHRFIAPTPIWFLKKFAYIIIITLIVKILLGIYFYVKYKHDDSPIYKSLMLDSFLDCGITLVTLISFTLSNKSGVVIDAFVGLFISIFMTICGIKLIIYSLSFVLGKNNGEIINSIKTIISGFNKDITIEDVFIHDYGKYKKTAEIHLSYNYELDYMELQNNIKNTLKEKLGICSVIEWRLLNGKEEN